MDKEFVGYSLVGGSSSFTILTTIAMLIYRGGNPVNSNLQYSFTKNFFSDLGRLEAFNGNSNFPVYILFMISLIAVSLSLVPFFIFIINYFKDTKSRKRFILSILGTVTGSIAMISYIGIAFTPWDQFLFAHMIFVYTAFIFILPSALIYSYLLLKEKQTYPSFMGYTFIGFFILGFLYLILLFFGPSEGEYGRIIQAVGQKIIVYTEIITFFIQGIGILKIKSS